MRITHVALGDPEGPAHTGYEADCGPCRVRLLEAFRAPADVPEQTDRRGAHPGWLGRSDPNRCPFCQGLRSDMRDHIRNVHPDQFLAWSGHPTVQPDGWARTTDLGHPQEHASPAPPPDGWLDQNPVLIVHTTDHGIINSEEGEGGTWWASCSCGWEAGGAFVRDTGARPAARLARIKANDHRENPK
jgi:hypothetical protein